jgi:hypothetical protein
LTLRYGAGLAFSFRSCSGSMPHTPPNLRRLRGRYPWGTAPNPSPTALGIVSRFLEEIQTKATGPCIVLLRQISSTKSFMLTLGPTTNLVGLYIPCAYDKTNGTCA